ncbi:MAG: hypothetical protein RIG61_04830 [Deltaproteobacteria bacterium]
MKKFMTLAAVVVTAGALGLGVTGYADDNKTQYEQQDQPYHDTHPHKSDQIIQQKNRPHNSGDSMLDQRNESGTDRGNYQSRQMSPDNRNSSGNVQGTVTLVGNRVINISEPNGMKHQVRVSESQEKAITTGYNISADIRNGKLVSFQEMGVAPDVKNVVYQSENLPDINVLENRGTAIPGDEPMMNRQQPGMNQGQQPGQDMPRDQHQDHMMDQY